MARHRLASIWSQIQKQAKQHWGELPYGEFGAIERRRDVLASLFQERFSMTREEAERQVDQWRVADPNSASTSAG